MHLDAMLHQGVDVPLGAVLPGCCAKCLPAWDTAVGSTVRVCEVSALVSGFPNPRGQHPLETMSQMNVKTVQPTHAEHIRTCLMGETAANVCFRNKGLASQPHAENTASTSQTTVLALWEPAIFYKN